MYDLINKEIDKIYRKYTESAEEIVSSYNRECDLSKDYEGRQMFELLQNADDEATDSVGKVLITFDGRKLSVSNTGTPFSFNGVKSLLYPNASPKKIRANKIGCKGLGFRSILSWSNSVTVSTKEFTIQFAREYAREFLDEILKKNPNLRAEIAEISHDETPIATLTCPHLLSDSRLVNGFSTSIIMDCHDELSEEIEKQIKSLEFEELIFLPNLKEIEIICRDYHKIFYKVVDGNDVIIETEDKHTQEKLCVSWKLYKDKGIIQDEKGEDKDYEFILAYDQSRKHYGNVLYSYFKTDVTLKFPALIHGTFELSSDRNSLHKQSIVNKQLINLLADFMVETAVKISKEQEKCDYLPLSLVISSDIDNVLKENYKLDELLRKKVREKKILPTIAGEYVSINDMPRYSFNNFASVLDPTIFSLLLKRADDDVIGSFLRNELHINFYDYEEFCEMLNSNIDYYSMEQKVALIALVISEYYSEGKRIYEGMNPEYKNRLRKSFPHLITDSNGKIIDYAVKIYPLPYEEQIISLPEWVDIKFLNQDMEKLLYKELKLGNNKRGLVEQLSIFNLDEYSFDSLLRGVVNQLDNNVITKEKCSDILNWLWNYYNLEDHIAILDVKVKVICRDGNIRSASECYIGKEYGNELGERLISLYSDKFVAYNELKINSKDTERIIGFLEWLGVSKYPRLVKKDLLPNENMDFVKYCYPLYVQNDGCWYSENDFNKIKKVIVGFFEELDTIIERANFNDIIAWFLLDPIINSRLCSDTEEKNVFSCITGNPYKKYNLRTVSPNNIKSYLKFFLSNTKWIPSESGVKEIPSYCCFEDNSLEPFIIVPNINYLYIRNIVGRNCKKDIEAILTRIGISDVFQEMDSSIIYQTLMNLPKLDPECKKARSLYRKIIRDGLSPEDYIDDNPYYEQFVKEGYVVARKNGIKQYELVSNVRYADKKVFSDDILKSFSMFDIDTKAGEEKVKKLFGVSPLKYTNVEIDGVPELHPLDEIFKKKYLEFIPFVLACRMGLKNSSDDFRILKISKVILCTKIAIKCMFGKEIKVSNLKSYEYVYIRKSNVAYLCAPNNFADFDDMQKLFEFADAVAELVTTILNVNEGKDFYRDLFRDTDLVRLKKMRCDKGDDNLELLYEARRRFKSEINPRDEFWMAIAEVVKLPNIEISESTANELIKALNLNKDIDKDIQYNDLNCFESIEAMISIFDDLGIDVDQYNSVTVHNIDTTKYWKNILQKKMQRFSKKYQAYLIHELKDKENCVELYDQCKEEYTYLEPTINNSLFVNIDDVFEKEFSVSFESLNQYNDNDVDFLIEEKKSKIIESDINKLFSLYSKQKVEAYLLFEKIHELFEPSIVANVEPDLVNYNGVKELVGEVFASPTEGFANISTQVIGSEQLSINNGKHRKHNKKIHLESSDQKNQEIGMVGEACVYKELLVLYPNAMWVSGNAEKAGYTIKGDDTCGYDIKYIDNNDEIQYVEVKSSRNKDISFSISDSELKFGCNHASSYEIIYVVIGDDGLPLHKPWRLGHIFEFAEGEDLLHNGRFTIESERYTVVAKLKEN